MARISVWFVRSALVHFALGATAGAWQLAATSGLWPVAPLPLRPLHVEVVLIGWVCQLAAGVALWIFPFSRGVSADVRFWIAWGALNMGIALVVAGAWSEMGALHVAGRGCEVVAGLLVIWGLWPRLQALPQRRHG